MGFRKGLFGFNCDDVMEYIEAKHKEYADKETVLNERIEELSDLLNNAQRELGDLRQAKKTAEDKLKKYTDKYEEIDRLSQNIGKLYLVAQANAQSVMNSAEENRKESLSEVEKNLNSIENAHRSLEEIKAKVEKTSSDFSDEINALMLSLDNTKRSIDSRNSESGKDENENRAVFAELMK